MTLAALIFDVDGTLADTEDLHRRAFNAAFAEHGLAFHWGRTRYRALLGISGGKERLAHFVAGLDLGAAERARIERLLPALHRAKTARYAELVAAGEAPLRAGVARLIGEARVSGVGLAIATTTTPANVAALLSRALDPEAPGWFDAIAAGDCVARKKPAPDVYALALARLGLPAARCVAFEDSAIGLVAARSAGLRTIVTPSLWTADDDVSAADLILPDLDALGGLDALRRRHDGWLNRRPEAA